MPINSVWLRSVKAVRKKYEWLWRKASVKEMSCKSGVKGRWSDRWCERKVVTVMRWYAQDEVNQVESEQNKVDGMKNGADSTGEVMLMTLYLRHVFYCHFITVYCFWSYTKTNFSTKEFTKIRQVSTLKYHTKSNFNLRYPAITN